MPCRQPNWLPPLLAPFLILLVVLLGSEALNVLVGPNLHTVSPDCCYRCAQPSPRALEHLVRTCGIRTVINLRGTNVGTDWYDEERAAANRLHVVMVDVSLSAHVPPPTEELQTLVRALHEGEEPFLLHCGKGSDRTGLAAALYLLLRTDASLDQARRQLHWRYGHLRGATATTPEHVLGAYDRWLREQDWEHQPARLRLWVDEVYSFRHWRHDDVQ